MTKIQFRIFHLYLLYCDLIYAGWYDDHVYDASVPLLSQEENPAYESVGGGGSHAGKALPRPPTLPKPSAKPAKPKVSNSAVNYLFIYLFIYLLKFLLDRGPFYEATGNFCFGFRMTLPMGFKARVHSLSPALFCQLRATIPSVSSLVAETGSAVSNHRQLTK